MANVPINTSSGGNVAGLDANPPVNRKADKPKYKRKTAVFDVDPKMFAAANKLKQKWGRWARFVKLGEEQQAFLDELQEYYLQNPNTQIAIRNTITKDMRFIKL